MGKPTRELHGAFMAMRPALRVQDLLGMAGHVDDNTQLVLATPRRSRAAFERVGVRVLGHRIDAGAWSCGGEPTTIRLTALDGGQGLGVAGFPRCRRRLHRVAVELDHGPPLRRPLLLLRCASPSAALEDGLWPQQQANGSRVRARTWDGLVLHNAVCTQRACDAGMRHAPR